MSNTRLRHLQHSIPENTLVFITKESDITYFVDFDFLVSEEKEAYLVVTQKTVTVLYASFSPVKKTPEIQYFPDIYPSQITDRLSTIITKEKISTAYIDKTHTTVTEYELLLSLKLLIKELPSPLIVSQKMIKDASEIEKITKACQISTDSFQALKNDLQEGQTELEVKMILESYMEKKGSQKTAFPTIVAFGEHGALPHHQPTDKKLEKNMPVLIDFGATYQKYRSDMTRSFWFGNEVSTEFTKIESIVQSAYTKALEATQDGLGKAVCKIDNAAREYIEKAGYGAHFIHTTGHGVGLDIHEQPSLNWKNQQPLQNGMVITIEPGIYLKNKFGYRHENTLLVDITLPKKVKELT